MFSTLTPVIFAENTMAIMTPGYEYQRDQQRYGSRSFETRLTINGDDFAKDDTDKQQS